jgi:hypothetical protein
VGRGLDGDDRYRLFAERGLSWWYFRRGDAASAPPNHPINSMPFGSWASRGDGVMRRNAAGWHDLTHGAGANVAEAWRPERKPG